MIPDAQSNPPVRRTRTKSMSRRTETDLESGEDVISQRGYVYQKGRKKMEPWDSLAPSYGRFRIDVAGERGQKEVRIALGRCKDKVEAMLRLHKKMEETGVLSVEKVREAIGLNSSFRVQAEWYLGELRTGGIVSIKSNLPVQPTTVAIYSTAVNYLLGTFVADLPLGSIGNAEAKRLVKLMMEDRAKGRFSESCKTIREYFAVLKLVIASAVDEKGEALHPRVWNYKFICLPKLQKKMQIRQQLSRQELEYLIQNAERRHAVLYAFLAATGLRRSEALGLLVSHLSNDCSTITIKQQRTKNGAVKATLKTDAARRTINVHPTIARMLRAYVDSRKEGYLFHATKVGWRNRGKGIDNPIYITVEPANIQRDSLDGLMKQLGRGTETGEGFHMLRRFRKSVLIEAGIEPLVRDFWFGHADESMDKTYGESLLSKTAYLKEQAIKAGLGFDVPVSLLGIPGLQSKELVAVVAA
jgi:integrase